MRDVSPLRYPGGKAKLFNFFSDIININEFNGRTYIEPYVGGAGLALKLLWKGVVPRVVLNDLDEAVFYFWEYVVREPQNLVRKINDVDVTVDEFYKQRDVLLESKKHLPSEVAFACLYVNRTSRSGILKGAGVIGGNKQDGRWKVDARFNKGELCRRINVVASMGERINLFNLDALEFLYNTEGYFGGSLFYLDPPYFRKRGDLYKNEYSCEDHARVADFVRSNSDEAVVVSYDNCSEIRYLYDRLKKGTIGLPYSAGDKRKAQEVMFFSNGIRKLPNETSLYFGNEIYV